MAANIFVDPVIVATPSDEADRAGIVAWLQNLEIWLKEALSAHFLWLHARTITEQLEAYGRLPNFEVLRGWVNHYHLDINPRLLARDINTFFRDPEHDLENRLLDLGYVAEGHPVEIEPAQIVWRWPEFIQNQMYNLLTTCCVCKHMAHAFANNLNIVTLELADHAQEMRVSTLIKDAIPEVACNPGDTLIQIFPLLFAPKDLFPLIDVQLFWYKGMTGIVYVIEQQAAKDPPTNSSEPLKFTLGLHFISSVENAGLDTNRSILPKIIRCSADVITNRAKDMRGYELEEIRQTKSPSSPGRVRQSDAAAAWRLRISKGGAGWRLHYWHIPGPTGGSIEFSNVCKESDATIYE